MDCASVLITILLVLMPAFQQGAQFTTTNEEPLTDDGVARGDVNQSSYCHRQYPKDCSEVLQGCSSLSSGVYIIQPTGYPHPFPVYCDFSSGGWTVIQCRGEKDMNFNNRFWEDYRTGFGSVAKEHWLGNDKIHYITSQANYEVQFDITLEDGTEFTVAYRGFRLGNESSGYALEHLGAFSSGGNGTITTVVPCDPSTEGSYCPVGFLLEGSECIPRRECACFWVDEERLIPNDQSLLGEGCTVKMSCESNRLIRTEVACSPHAHCIVQDGERRCRCRDGYGGDGHSCVRMRDCQDVFDQGNTATGVHAILPEGWPGQPFNVSCNMTREGGWTVFQRRVDGSVNFNRNWSSYKEGFGSVDHEHWLGNDKLFYLTNQRSYELGVDRVNSLGYRRFYTYRSFRLNNEADSYRLDTEGLYRTNGKAFSTYDRDRDGCDVNCAEGHKGGWWYSDELCSLAYSISVCNMFAVGSSYTSCTYFNPNGNYSGGPGEHFFWGSCYLSFIEMKIRPRSEDDDGPSFDYYSSY